MKRLIVLAGVAVLGAGVARADVEPQVLDPLDPVRIVSPLTLVQGDGIKIGEGTLLYPQVGLETGYESNTFFQANDPVGSGILRVLVEAGLGSLSKMRLGETPPGELIYEANAYASYDQYISDNSDAMDQSGLAAGFHGNMLVHPEGTVSFYANEGFDRVLRPTNYESRTNDTRDINALILRLDIHPSGSAFSGQIMYTNVIDSFENQTIYPDRLQNTLGARLNYQLFPLTSTFVQVSGGYFTGIGDTVQKVNSYPFLAALGMSTALTVSTSLLAEAGYQQGFYASGPDYQAPFANVYLEYRYNDISALRLRYGYDSNDSINANFYSEHVLQGWLEHKIDRFGVFVSPEVRFREYNGINGAPMGNAVRNDVIFAAAVGLRYQFRNWVSASAEYDVVDDSTDYRYIVGGMPFDPSYVRHEIFAGVRLAY